MMFYLVLLSIEILILYLLSQRVVKTLFHFSYKVTKRKNWAMYLFAILFLPGTFIHEVSHFLAALFLLVPVGEVKLTPRFKDEGVGIDLGSVAIAKTDPIRRFLIGVAPFVFGCAIIFLTLYLTVSDRFIKVWWGNLFTFFLIFQISNSMFASKKDLEGAVILLIFVVFIFALLYILDIRLPFDISDLTTMKSFNVLLKSASVYLLVPIVIDWLVFLIFRRYL